MYEARISLMREGVCWYYDRGWPFVDVAVSSREGVRSLERVRVLTRAPGWLKANVRRAPSAALSCTRPPPRSGATAV